MKSVMMQNIWIVAIFAILSVCQSMRAADVLPDSDKQQLTLIVNKYVKAYRQIKEAEERLNQLGYMETSADSVRYKREEEKVNAMKKRAEDELMSALHDNPNFLPIAKIHEIVKSYVSQRKQAEIGHVDNFSEFEAEWDEKLIKLVDENSDFMEYPPELLAFDLSPIDGICNLSVADSDDKRLRYYSWYTNRGGSMANIVCFRQFRSDSGKVLLSWGSNYDFFNDNSWEWLYYVEDISTLEVDGANIYLVKALWNYGGGNVSEAYFANAIKLSQITNPDIFSTTDIIASALVVDYNAFQWEGEKGVDWMIKFDKEKRSILLRETDEKGILTGVVREYTFDGNVFW